MYLKIYYFSSLGVSVYPAICRNIQCKAEKTPNSLIINISICCNEFIRHTFISCSSICFFYPLHAVFHTEQGRQREPSVKTLCSPISAEFWRHCVLSGKTQRCALPRHQRDENGNINLRIISSSGDRTHNQLQNI